MCGIVGAIAQRDVAEILLEGLRRLEYRGYDSAGLAVVDAEGHMTACVASVKSRCCSGSGRTSSAWRYGYCSYSLGDTR